MLLFVSVIYIWIIKFAAIEEIDRNWLTEGLYFFCVSFQVKSIVWVYIWTVLERSEETMWIDGFGLRLRFFFQIYGISNSSASSSIRILRITHSLSLSGFFLLDDTIHLFILYSRFVVAVVVFSSTMKTIYCSFI